MHQVKLDPKDAVVMTIALDRLIAEFPVVRMRSADEHEIINRARRLFGSLCGMLEKDGFPTLRTV